MINTNIPKLYQDKDVNISLAKDRKIGIPLLAANMDTVISEELAFNLINSGTYPIFHRFCEFMLLFVHFGLGQASPGAFGGVPCTFCVPRVHSSSDLGVQGCPWSTTWALFGVTLRTFAHTLAAHVPNTCFYGHPGCDLEAKWPKSDVHAPS